MLVGKDWHWFFDAEQNRLCIKLDGDLVFQVHYPPSRFNYEAFNKAPFSMEDAEFYQHALNTLSETYNDPHPYLVQAALNATAAKRFLKPQMPKSWFFLPGSSRLTLQEGVLVQMQSTCDTGEFFILETSETTSVCMLFKGPLELNESKSMQAFDVIKVMNDRVTNYVTMGFDSEDDDLDIKFAG